MIPVLFAKHDMAQRLSLSLLTHSHVNACCVRVRGSTNEKGYLDKHRGKNQRPGSVELVPVLAHRLRPALLFH